MVLLALAALVLGVAWGSFGPAGTPLDLISDNSDLILYALMFFVGISIGLNKTILQKIREYHIKVFIIPFGIVVGSVAAGVVCGLLTGVGARNGAAIAGGMGWYSLAGVMLTEMAGAQMGSVAFLSNLMREMLSFFSIPWISRHLNCYSCIAPAGATSEDTTLSMMVRYTSEEVVVMSVFNGIICSAVVPVLIRLCYSL
ncbi:MAG TPA: lysine exporter LysO family protein [Candidatus Anaerofilum faecale]|nr:lysine exporter LysO family protein [Candidatus Anaerofilum faecale]